MTAVGITGMGAISALGFSLQEHLDALRAGRSGIRSLDAFSPIQTAFGPVGQVQVSTEDLRAEFGNGDVNLTRTSLLALHAVRDALADAGLDAKAFHHDDAAVVVGTTVGGMCLTDNLYADATEPGSDLSVTLKNYEYDFIAGTIRARYGLSGYSGTINTACSSSANAIVYGARMISNGLARRVIVGGSDSLARFTVSGFRALRLISDKPCRPFDRDRDGLNLGEGAAFLVLEKISENNRGRVKAVLSGYGNTCDAHHPTTLSEQARGPVGAMRQALVSAGMDARDIQYVNAHGTATENNDLVESLAMQTVMGNGVPFSSTKSFTGHTLGAAGALEAVFSVLSLQHGLIFPSLQFEQPIVMPGLVPVRETTRLDLRHVMSNSFGFGGNCTALILSKFSR